jgi:hypothetical protein
MTFKEMLKNKNIKNLRNTISREISQKLCFAKFHQQTNRLNLNESQFFPPILVPSFLDDKTTLMGV